MPNTSNKTKFSSLRNQVEQLIRSSDNSVPTSLVQALRSLLTAMHYEDAPMMRAHVETARDVLIDHVTEEVEKRLKWSTKSWDGVQKFLSMIEDEPCEPSEQFDELGQAVSYLVSSTLSMLTSYWTEQVRDVGTEFPVPNASQLETEIKRWRVLKENVVDGWPWGNRELPPVDRKMVAESRESLNRNEGEAIEDLIRRLGGNPTRNS